MSYELFTIARMMIVPPAALNQKYNQAPRSVDVHVCLLPARLLCPGLLVHLPRPRVVTLRNENVGKAPIDSPSVRDRATKRVRGSGCLVRGSPVLSAERWLSSVCGRCFQA